MVDENEERRTVLGVSLHGTGVTIDDAINAGTATKELLEAISQNLGHDVRWMIESVQFRCDGCGLTRPDRPGPDDGWTFSGGDDYCPACTAGAP